jgi:hypothetical protein
MTTPIQAKPQNRVIANAQTTAAPSATNRSASGTLPPEIQSLLLDAYANSLPSSSIKNKLVAQFKAALMSGVLKAGQGDAGFAFKELIQTRYSELQNNAGAQKAFYEALEKTSKLCEIAVNFGIKKLAKAIEKALESTAKAKAKAGATPPTTPEAPVPTTAPTTPTTTTPVTQSPVALSVKDKELVNAASSMTLADLNSLTPRLQADSSGQIASATVKAYVSESSILFAALENNRAAFEALKRSSPEAAAVIDQALNSQLSLQERLIALYQLSSLPSAAAILGGETQARLQSLVTTGAAVSTASS